MYSFGISWTISSRQAPHGAPLDPSGRTARTFRISCPVSFDSNAIFINLLDFFDETDDFKAYSGFVNNYLILKNGKEYYYRDINRFVFCLLEKIL